MCKLQVDPAFKGLGIFLCDTKNHMVKDVEPNSPAERAGLKPGDKILLIGDTNVEDLTYLDVFHKLREALLNSQSIDLLVMNAIEYNIIKAAKSEAVELRPQAPTQGLVSDDDDDTHNGFNPFDDVLINSNQSPSFLHYATSPLAQPPPNFAGDSNTDSGEEEANNGAPFFLPNDRKIPIFKPAMRIEHDDADTTLSESSSSDSDEMEAAPASSDPKSPPPVFNAVDRALLSSLAAGNKFLNESSKSDNNSMSKKKADLMMDALFFENFSSKKNSLNVHNEPTNLNVNVNEILIDGDGDEEDPFKLSHYSASVPLEPKVLSEMAFADFTDIFSTSATEHEDDNDDKEAIHRGISGFTMVPMSGGSVNVSTPKSNINDRF